MTADDNLTGETELGSFNNWQGDRPGITTTLVVGEAVKMVLCGGGLLQIIHQTRGVRLTKVNGDVSGKVSGFFGGQ